MSNKLKTIAAVTQPRQHHVPAKARAPLTQEERKEKTEASAQRQSEMNADVQAIIDDIFDCANTLASKYDKKLRGGAHMVHKQTEVNPYNAFKSEKVAELREAGTPMNAGNIHKTFHQEYVELFKGDKAALVARHEQNREAPPVRRATPRARVQDFPNMVHNMEMLLSGLALRVGVEGFFVVVRNNTDCNCEPFWYFTSSELRQYMPLAVRKHWDTAQVGMKLEAFALAGCDTLNLLRTAPQKAAQVKMEIRDRILQMLVEITGNPNAQVAYVNHEEDIVFKYDKWCNPSELTTSLPVLRKLLNAIKSGECKFKRLSVAELKARKDKYEEDIAAGRITGKQHNPRSDIGKKRKRTTDVEEPDDVAVPPPEKRRKAPSQPAAPKKTSQRKPLAKKSANQPAAKPRARAKLKTTAAGRENRDDDTTRAALARLKSGKAPGSRGGQAFKSRAIISSDDEDDDSAAPAAGAMVVVDVAASSTSSTSSAADPAPVVIDALAA
ncbi:hypothetical protein MVEN_00042400 [Mycena venus]|uniref:Uncharacterized protein n=1 Tax=Mycena venus TaxID=2733690 RepID=A0A8H6Z9X2_9AGAR|nr:hypothetical protein MVEN_00042400 [Mycena venus]